MDIILDSNIYRGDFSLRSKDFVVMKDYLQKTASSLMVPQVILDEIKGLYARTLTERIVELRRAVRNYHHALINDEYRVNNKLLDIENAVSEYEEFIRQKLDIRDRHIIPYDNEFLPEITRRAIQREKPAGEEGQGFRDVLIWLTLKQHVVKRPGKKLAFISNNTADFGNKAKDGLHESLIEECKQLGVQIIYFKNLREFIERHSMPIEFISYDWVQEQLDFEKVECLLFEHIEAKEKSNLLAWYQSKLGSHLPTGKVTPTNMEPDIPRGLSVYELSDGPLIVNFTLSVDLEVEFDYFTTPPAGLFSQRGGSLLDLGDLLGGGISSEIKKMETDLYLTLTVDKESKTVTSVELSEVDFES